MPVGVHEGGIHFVACRQRGLAPSVTHWFIHIHWVLPSMFGLDNLGMDAGTGMDDLPNSITNTIPGNSIQLVFTLPGPDLCCCMCMPTLIN
jgi:hypothetical protein